MTALPREREDLFIYKGNTHRFTFTLTDSAGAAINYSGATSVKITAKQKISDTTALFTSTATDGAIGNSWSTGIIVIEVSAVNTALLSPHGVYDLEITRSDGRIQSPCYGELFVQSNVG